MLLRGGSSAPLTRTQPDEGCDPIVGANRLTNIYPIWDKRYLYPIWDIDCLGDLGYKIRNIIWKSN